jgi:putative endonuclease
VPHTRASLGALGEDLATEHLERRGYAILARNVRTRAGEIDVIAFGEGAIVFVEVKTRRVRGDGSSRTAGHGPDPLEAIGVRKRLQVRRLAAAWLAESPSSRPRAREIRFDAISVLVDGRDRLARLDHLEDAW